MMLKRIDRELSNGVESQNIEFKSTWRDEYLKVICAFANVDGGRLIIGVDDKGKPTGVENAKKLLEEGTLPKDIKIADLKKSHPSRPRNELLADVFFKAGLIEAWGRGTIKITNECKKAGLPEPEFKEEFGGFSIYFYKDIFTEENLRKMGLNERQIKAVMYVKDKGKITNKEYQEINTVSNKTAYLELSNIVERGVLILKGSGRKISYALKVMKE